MCKFFTNSLFFFTEPSINNSVNNEALANLCASCMLCLIYVTRCHYVLQNEIVQE